MHWASISHSGSPRSRPRTTTSCLSANRQLTGRERQCLGPTERPPQDHAADLQPDVEVLDYLVEIGEDVWLIFEGHVVEVVEHDQRRLRAERALCRCQHLPDQDSGAEQTVHLGAFLDALGTLLEIGRASCRERRVDPLATV